MKSSAAKATICAGFSGHVSQRQLSPGWKKTLAICPKLICGWNPSQAGWHLDWVHEAHSNPLHMLASAMLESPRLCCPSAGAEPEGPWKGKEKGSLNLSDDNFHKEREVRVLSCLQLLQAAPSMGRSDVGQELEPELFDRKLFLQTGAMSCVTAVRSAVASCACTASLHSCCCAGCPTRGPGSHKDLVNHSLLQHQLHLD